ncbi:hypothetical protein [Actinocorallia longicatena]|uniref:Uncharacterized protein n=1 Tax=Actinocorallia longicatena TaxID=111803 RepID=A0ABP6PYS6_9ACTN
MVTRRIRRAAVGGALALTLAATTGYAVESAGEHTHLDRLLVAAHFKAAPRLAALKLARTRLTGGGATYGVVRLTAKAPKGGARVRLAARSRAYIRVPGFVKVPAGRTTARFPITTKKIGRTGTGVVAAKFGGRLIKRPLTLTPKLAAVHLAKVTLVVGTTVGGAGEILGTATLNKPAPKGGATIKLASSDGHATFVHPTAFVPAGLTTGTFDIATTPTAALVTARIAAAYGGQILKRPLRVTAVPEGPPQVSHLNVHADFCVPGRQYEGNLDINRPAPAGGVKVTLKSSRPDLIPAQELVIPAGQGTVRYYFTPNQGTATVTLSADLNGTHVAFARDVHP